MKNDEAYLRRLNEALEDVVTSGSSIQGRARRRFNRLVKHGLSANLLTPRWTREVELYFLELEAARSEAKRKGTQRVEARYFKLLVSRYRAFLSRRSLFNRTFGGPRATPRNCELLLSLLLSKSEQEPAIGDFLERYEQKRQRLGRRRADLWAYSDVLRTVWPVLRRRLGTFLKFAVAADWVRRQFHQ